MAQEHSHSAHPKGIGRQLSSISKYRPGDPILVVSVDKKIMKNHGAIANPVLNNFLGEYLLFCQNDTPNRGRNS